MLINCIAFKRSLRLIRECSFIFRYEEVRNDGGLNSPQKRFYLTSLLHAILFNVRMLFKVQKVLISRRWQKQISLEAGKHFHCLSKQLNWLIWEISHFSMLILLWLLFSNFWWRFARSVFVSLSLSLSVNFFFFFLCYSLFDSNNWFPLVSSPCLSFPLFDLYFSLCCICKKLRKSLDCFMKRREEGNKRKSLLANFRFSHKWCLINKFWRIDWRVVIEKNLKNLSFRFPAFKRLLILAV